MVTPGSITFVENASRVYTNGYLFEEQVGPRKINIEAANSHGVEVCDMENLKSSQFPKTC